MCKLSDVYYTREDYTPQTLHHLRVERTGALLAEKPPTYYEDFFTYNETEDESTQFSLGYQAISPEQGIYRRTYRHIIFRFVVAGHGTLNGTPFGPGDFFYTEANTENSILPDREDPWQMYWFRFTKQHTCMAQLLRILADFEPGRVYHDMRAAELASLFHFALYGNHRGISMNPYIKGVVQIIGEYLTAALHAQVPKTDRPLPWNMAQAKSILDTEYATITIGELAERVHLERKYLSRVFTATYGYSPKEYLMQTRLRYSEVYLSETDYSAQQIAEMVGYKDQNSFLRVFRERTGMTPGQYRRYRQTKDRDTVGK